jgi:DNA polymerase I-like protein with 3'-5' exonuclease and polymerase domains
MINKLYKLFRLHCQDLLVLEEMEWNGMVFATEEALKYAAELETEIDAIIRAFRAHVLKDCVSISSGKHLSSILYGGTIVEEFRVPSGYYKTGAKQGQVKYSIVKEQHTFERLIDPLYNTETANSKKQEGDASGWSVSEEVLTALKPKGKAKQIIDLVLQYRKIEKLRGTYLQGYSDLIKQMNWEPNMLHGTLNQCVAVTGRLSSSKPNLQNADKKTKMFLRSRYDP